jgi:LAO/AO transport system kinase
VEEADRSLLDAVAAGHIRSAARLITRIERDDPGVVPLLQALYRKGGRSRVVGVTGPPGAGKSTLINALVRHWRRAGLRVAVLAIDPSSPFSGGAVLGDRLRMMDHSGDAASSSAAWPRAATSAASRAPRAMRSPCSTPCPGTWY